MKLFKTKPEAMTDEALDAIASTDENTRAALAERARRLQAKREADEAKKLADAAKAKASKVAALLKKHTNAWRDLTAAHAQLDLALVATAAALEARDTAQKALWAIEREVTSLSAHAPTSAMPGFSEEATGAAKKISATVAEAASTDSPFTTTVAAQVAAGRW
jgi:predicted translin family RNA/ssDNA-binding protein